MQLQVQVDTNKIFIFSPLHSYEYSSKRYIFKLVVDSSLVVAMCHTTSHPNCLKNRSLLTLVPAPFSLIFSATKLLQQPIVVKGAFYMQGGPTQIVGALPYSRWRRLKEVDLGTQGPCLWLGVKPQKAMLLLRVTSHEWVVEAKFLQVTNNKRQVVEVELLRVSNHGQLLTSYKPRISCRGRVGSPNLGPFFFFLCLFFLFFIILWDQNTIFWVAEF